MHTDKAIAKQIIEQIGKEEYRDFRLSAFEMSIGIYAIPDRAGELYFLLKRLITEGVIEKYEIWNNTENFDKTIRIWRKQSMKGGEKK